MSRFLLDDETIKQISNELPDLENLGMAVMKLVPDFIISKYSDESYIPVAAVCLQDTLNVLLQIRIGLNECFQHKIWYQEKCNPPNEELTIIYVRFYIDGIVSRLYAAAEHLANAIICILDLSDDQLEEYRYDRVSQQSIVGHYLANEQSDHPITKAVLMLVSSNNWKNAIAYRNNLIHEQPPTISGLGTVYKRHRRWVRSEEGTYINLGLGGGDDAEYSIDELLEFVKSAVFLFVDLFEKVVDFYIELINKRGIFLTEEGLRIKIL